MLNAYKKFWGFSYFPASINQTTFLKGIATHTIICLVLYFLRFKVLLLILVAVTFERFLRFCNGRLNDAGYASYWGLLWFTGVGIFYIIYLLLFKPSLSFIEGNKYKNKQVLLTDSESGNKTMFDILDEIVYNKENYIVVSDSTEEVPQVFILKVQNGENDFDTVCGETADKIFSIFKEKASENYEFV